MNKKFSRTYLYMTIPALALFFIFHTYPAIKGVFYSFTNWRGYGSYDFVGLKNYFNLFKDGRALDAYLFTFKFAIVSTILTNIISLAFAIALNTKIVIRKTLRAIYFLPNVLSILIVAFIFNFIFTHLLTNFGTAANIEVLTRNILGQPDLAWVGVMVVAVWQKSAFTTLIYLSGLQTIPQNLYEASSIDGANSWQNFLHITFPLIAPFFTINIVLAMKDFLMVFDHIMGLTGGGPGRATESISLLIYRGGFQGGEFAYQSANAVLYFVVITIVSFIQIKYLQKREVEL